MGFGLLILFCLDLLIKSKAMYSVEGVCVYIYIYYLGGSYYEHFSIYLLSLFSLCILFILLFVEKKTALVNLKNKS
jgi:hypothetical protein